MPKNEEARIRELKPGQWFAYGPALVDDDGCELSCVVKFTANKAKTTHPGPGDRRTLRPPAPSNKIRRFMPEFADLPQAPDERPEALKARVAELEVELAKARKRSSSTIHSAVPDPRIAESRHRKELASVAAVNKKQIGALQKDFAQIDKYVHGLLADTSTACTLIEGFRDRISAAVSAPSALPDPTPIVAEPKPERARTTAPVNGVEHVPSRDGGQRRILIALARFGGNGSRRDVAIAARLSPTSGTTATYLSALKSELLISGGSDLALLNRGYQVLGEYDPLPSPLGPYLIKVWRELVGGGGLERMFDALVAAGIEGLGRSELAEASGMKNSGTFATYVAKFRRTGICEDRKWPMRLSGIFFSS